MNFHLKKMKKDMKLGKINYICTVIIIKYHRYLAFFPVISCFTNYIPQSPYTPATAL